MQRNQHSGAERHKLSLIAGYEAALRDLGYSMNASRRPKPSSKRRNATPVIEGSIGEHCQAGGHTYTIYKWHRIRIKACEQEFAVNRWTSEAGNIDLAGARERSRSAGILGVCRQRRLSRGFGPIGNNCQ